jgi:hypothetical protein
MNRSSYAEAEFCCWDVVRWRGAVASAIKGRRGQSLLKRLRAAFDAHPDKKLVANSFAADGAFCTLGLLAHHKGIDLSNINPSAVDYERLADKFDVSEALVREIMFENDEGMCPDHYSNSDEEERFVNMRRWIERHITKPLG